MNVAILLNNVLHDKDRDIGNPRGLRITPDNQAENRSDDEHGILVELRAKLTREPLIDAGVVPFVRRYLPDFAINDFLNAFQFRELEPFLIRQQFRSGCHNSPRP